MDKKQLFNIIESRKVVTATSPSTKVTEVTMHRAEVNGNIIGHYPSKESAETAIRVHLRSKAKREAESRKPLSSSGMDPGRERQKTTPHG